MSKKKIFLSIFVGFVTLLGMNVFVIEPNMIEINEIKISDTGTQMKIGLIADFQRGTSDSSFVQRVVDIMNVQDLDVVLIAGDFIDKNPEELLSVEPLKKLKTRYGVYGVLGNHDYDVYFLNKNNVNLELGEKIKEFLESDGTIRILKNENITIEDVSIIGLDSYWAGLRDVDKAIAETSNEFKILFSHNQNSLEINPETANVYLFGHTHCGQIRLPYVGSVSKIIGFEGNYDYRHYDVNDTDVYTTCGLTPGPRLFNPPEITIINLS